MPFTITLAKAGILIATARIGRPRVSITTPGLFYLHASMYQSPRLAQGDVVLILNSRHIYTQLGVALFISETGT